MDARAWDERYAASDLVWSSTPNQFVAAELESVLPGRALDLATGEGRNALWLADRGWQVTAVDFSQAGLDKGRELQTRFEKVLHVDWVQADVLALDEDDIGAEPYDLALLAYLQLREDERRTAVRRAFASLRVGGRLLLVAHDSTNLTEGTGGPRDPSVLFTAEEVLGDLDGERFEVLRAERVPRVVATAEPSHTHEGDASATAYDALVHLERTG